MMRMTRAAGSALASAFLLVLPCSAADLTGQATVVDGDTIEIHGQRISRYGIDSPEAAQTCKASDTVYRCGQEAALALADHIGRHTVSCEQEDIDRYSRMVASCIADGQDIGAWLVENGWALAYRRFSTAYVHQEQTAESAERGIWRGDFVAPWDWRRGVR